MAKSPTMLFRSALLREVADGIASIESMMTKEGGNPMNYRLHFSAKCFKAVIVECRNEFGYPKDGPEVVNGVPWFMGYPVVLDMMDRDDDSISCCLMADGGNYYG